MKSTFLALIVLALPIFLGTYTIIFLIIENYNGYDFINSSFKLILYYIASGILGILLGRFCAWNFDPDNCKIPTNDTN